MTMVCSSRQIPTARNTAPTDSNSTVIHMEFKCFFALNPAPPLFYPRNTMAGSVFNSFALDIAVVSHTRRTVPHMLSINWRGAIRTGKISGNAVSRRETSTVVITESADRNRLS